MANAVPALERAVLVIGLLLINSRRARPADRTVYDDRAGRTV